MVDSFVSFSSTNSMDLFPSFKNFHEAKDDQGAFTVDKRDIEEMRNDIPTNPVQKSKKPKRDNVKSNSTEKTSSNSIAQCDICSVPISGPIVFDSHIKGKKHQTQLRTLLAKNPEYKAPTYEELCSKKPEPIVENNQSEPPKASVSDKDTVPPLIPSKKLNCNMCNVSCNSQEMFDNHVAGKKHQMKAKLNSLTSPAPARTVPDNNPSSSNYCDVCSMQLNSEDELTEHLAQKRHQTRVKDADFCAKETVEMNINFDDYKIATTGAEKDQFDFQCSTCQKKLRNKVQLIEHLKSALHIQLSNRPNSQRGGSRKPNRGTHQTPPRGGTATRGQSFSSFRGSSKPSGRSRPYQPSGSPWNQRTQPPVQHSTNPFGAFDPTNNYYTPTKRSTQYEQTSDEYDGFYPKRSRTYDTPQDSYSTDQNYYPSNSNTYSSHTSNSNTQSSALQPPWSYQTEPQYDQQQYDQSQYDQQQYSTSGSSYINPMHYPTNNPPPLPDYEPPPLPNYPPPTSHPRYPQSSTYPADPGNESYFQSSFHH